MDSVTSPLEQIKNLGRQVAVPVFDPLTKTTRSQIIDVFGRGAARFPGNDPICNVCNSIQDEVQSIEAKTGDKSISKPSIQTPDLGKDQSKDNSPDPRIRTI